MYTLRYNKTTKKIDVVQIMRTHIKDASYFHKKIIQKKISDSHAPAEEITEIQFSDQSDDKAVHSFDPDLFINKAIELMLTHRDRLKGIMMNIKNSNAVSREDKTTSSELEDIFRNIDIDGIQNFEKAENYQKELINYPRSITYYQAKIDKKGRDIIESLAGHNERIMKFIYIFEMFQTIKTLYRNLKKIINNLNDFIKEIDSDQIKNLNQGEKQSFKDADVSISNTIDEIEDILDDLRRFEDYVYNPSNF